jgi:hypothetical protein
VTPSPNGEATAVTRVRRLTDLRQPNLSRL